MSVYSSQLAKSVHEWSSLFFCDIPRHRPWFSFLEKNDFHKSVRGGVDITSASSVSCLSSPHVLSFRNAQLAFSEKRKRGGYVCHLIVVLSESAHTGCEVWNEIVCVCENGGSAEWDCVYLQNYWHRPTCCITLRLLASVYRPWPQKNLLFT